MPVIHAVVTREPLDVATIQASVSHPGGGALACFLGQIRNHDPEADGEVTGIDYTQHPDANRLLGEIAEEVTGRLDPSGEAYVAIAHRVGQLGVGELALVAAVATPHRREAFELCEALVEAVKAHLPIWKQQTEASGRQVWSKLNPAP